jgi:hypothetical protein
MCDVSENDRGANPLSPVTDLERTDVRTLAPFSLR